MLAEGKTNANDGVVLQVVQLKEKGKLPNGNPKFDKKIKLSDGYSQITAVVKKPENLSMNAIVKVE